MTLREEITLKAPDGRKGRWDHPDRKPDHVHLNCWLFLKRDVFILNSSRVRGLFVMPVALVEVAAAG